jgi:hypothetical protein
LSLEIVKVFLFALPDGTQEKCCGFGLSPAPKIESGRAAPADKKMWLVI